MTARSKGQFPDLSRADLEVLKPLWTTKAMSAREVHDAMNNGWAYTTTRTMLERLVAKGHIARKRVHGLNVFEARVSRVRAVAGMVRDFAQSVLEVEPSRVVPLFLEGQTLSPAEVDELEILLQEEKK